MEFQFHSAKADVNISLLSISDGNEESKRSQTSTLALIYFEVRNRGSKESRKFASSEVAKFRDIESRISNETAILLANEKYLRYDPIQALRVILV